MIFGSLLLIFAAIALAVLGVMQGSNPLIIGSIGASLLAAVALIVGARQAAGSVPAGDESVGPGAGGLSDAGQPGGDDLVGATVAGTTAGRAERSGRGGGRTEPPGQRPHRPQGGTVYGAEPGTVAVADPLTDTVVRPTRGTPDGVSTQAPTVVGPPAARTPLTTPTRPAAPDLDTAVLVGPDHVGEALAGDPLAAVPRDRDPAGDRERPSDRGRSSGDEPSGGEPGGGDEPDALRDEPDSLRDEPDALRDEPDSLRDEPDSLRDEPEEQAVDPADKARVARLTVDVLVIDGRPRYHLSGCIHLLGAEHEPIPVNEAVELGFTPCALCEPDSALLADARRV